MAADRLSSILGKQRVMLERMEGEQEAVKRARVYDAHERTARPVAPEPPAVHPDQCTMGCRPEDGCIIEDNGKGEMAGSKCGQVLTVFAAQIANTRVFADDDAETKAAKVHAEEYRKEELRHLVKILGGEVGSHDADVLWKINNRLNQTYVWLRHLSDERPGGFWLTQGEIMTAKTVLRTACVQWGKEGCNEERMASPVFWTIAVALQMVALRPEGFKVPTKELQSIVTLHGLHNYLSEFASDASVTGESDLASTRAKGKRDGTAKAQRLMESIKKRNARFDELGRTQHQRYEKLLVLSKLLINSKIWGGDPETGGLHRSVMMEYEPELMEYQRPDNGPPPITATRRIFVGLNRHRPQSDSDTEPEGIEGSELDELVKDAFCENGEEAGRRVGAPAGLEEPPFDASNRQLTEDEIKWYADHRGWHLDKNGDVDEPPEGLVSIGIGRFHPNADAIRREKMAKAEAKAEEEEAQAERDAWKAQNRIAHAAWEAAEKERRSKLPLLDPAERARLNARGFNLDEYGEEMEPEGGLMACGFVRVDPAEVAADQAAKAKAKAEKEEEEEEQEDEGEEEGLPEDLGLNEQEWQEECDAEEAFAREEAEAEAAAPAPAAAPVEQETPKFCRPKIGGTKYTKAKLAKLGFREFFSSYNFKSKKTAEEQHALKMWWTEAHKEWVERERAKAEAKGRLEKLKREAEAAREARKEERRQRKESRRADWLEKRVFNQTMARGAKVEAAEDRAKRGYGTTCLLASDEVIDRKNKVIPVMKVRQYASGKKIQRKTWEAQENCKIEVTDPMETVRLKLRTEERPLVHVCRSVPQPTSKVEPQVRKMGPKLGKAFSEQMEQAIRASAQ